MASENRWGEFEDDNRSYPAAPTEKFKPIMELGMQNIPELPITVKSSPIELPRENLITHTVQLHGYYRRLSAIMDKAQNEGTTLDIMSIPSIPPEPLLKMEHVPTTPVNFYEKEYCDFAYGNGPIILPFTPECHQRALRQCAAIALGHIGVVTCTNTALTAVTDALDYYMSNMCKLLRTVVDREASGLTSGFADPISKVFADLNVGNLHDFYQNRVVRYHSKIKNKCLALREQCEKLTVSEVAAHIKLEEVPELHFPAALDGAFTPSLEPGFQMLQSLEQDQLQGLDIVDPVKTENIKIKTEVADSTETSNMEVFSPTAKKKKKKINVFNVNQ